MAVNKKITGQGVRWEAVLRVNGRWVRRRLSPSHGRALSSTDPCGGARQEEDGSCAGACLGWHDGLLVSMALVRRANFWMGPVWLTDRRVRHGEGALDRIVEASIDEVASGRRTWALPACSISVVIAVSRPRVADRLVVQAAQGQVDGRSGHPARLVRRHEDRHVGHLLEREQPSWVGPGCERLLELFPAHPQ